MSEPFGDSDTPGGPVFFEGENHIDIPLKGYPGWWASVGFNTVDERAEPVALRIYRRGGTGSVTTNMLRAIHLPEFRREAAEFLERQVGQWGGEGLFGRSTTTAERDERARALARAFRKERRPGRRGRGDKFFAQIAQVYVDACRTEEHPVKHLSTVYHLSASQVRSILNTARNKGLLTPSPPGQAGGQLTDKAKEILDGQH